MAQASVDAAVSALDGKGDTSDRKAAEAAIRDAVRYLGDDSSSLRGGWAGTHRERPSPPEAVRLLDEATKNKDNAQDANLWAALAAAYKKSGR